MSICTRRLLAAAVLAVALPASANEPSPRARDIGIPFAGTPGSLNAITDVAGVEVGYTTLVSGDAAHPPVVRTGVTAVLPRGRAGGTGAVFGGWFTMNGNGEMTGTTWLEESGTFAGPVMITNTHSVGVVRDAVIAWSLRVAREQGRETADWSLPVVGETWDGFLNDLNGFHVKPEHVFAALDGARGGAVAEGNVGGGTGMHTFEFKGGMGTSSRRVRRGGVEHVVGVLVQSNFGRRHQLQIAGLPMGRELKEHAPYSEEVGLPNELGSIIAVVATDAPLLPHQLERVAKRVAMGVARVGGSAGNGSGDIFIAFSTANAEAASATTRTTLEALANDQLDGIFEATVHATEEAIVNAMVAARTMEGLEGHVLHAIDHDAIRRILRRHRLLHEP